MDGNKIQRAFFIILPIVTMMFTRPAQARDRKAPVIKHQAVHEATQGQDLELHAKISDRSGLFEPTLYYRQGHKGTFKRLPLIKKGASYHATIPAAEVSGKSLEYFLESYDQQGNGPARFGGPDKAIKVTIKPKTVVVDNSTQHTEPGDQNSTHADADNPKAEVHEIAATKVKESETANNAQQTKNNHQPTQADDEDQDLTPWIIVGASTLGVVVVAGVVGGILWWNASQTPETPPGDVTLQVGAPPPYSSALRARP